MMRAANTFTGEAPSLGRRGIEHMPNIRDHPPLVNDSPGSFLGSRYYRPVCFNQSRLIRDLNQLREA
jgi:hypothetical protein